MFSLKVAPWEQIGLLEDHSDLGLGTVNKIAVQQNLATRQRMKPAHRPEQRRFAASGRSDNRDEFAILDLK